MAVPATMVLVCHNQFQWHITKITKRLAIVAAEVHDAVRSGNCERRFRPTIANYDNDDDDIIII